MHGRRWKAWLKLLMDLLSIVLLFLVKIICCSALPVVQYSNPSTVSGGGTLYVPVDEGQLNFLIECVVFNGGSQAVTSWAIQRDGIESMLTSITFMNGMISTPADLIDVVTIIGEPVPGLEDLTFLSNFTILNFTSQFDTTIVRCGPSSDRRLFTLGFPGWFF